jgi:pilus assembly protein CpaB
MARAGAGGPASRINRRFLLLTIICAMLSAVLVYAAVSRGGKTEQTESAGLTGVTVVARVDIPARTQITAEMLMVKDLPVAARTATALENIEDAVGKLTRYPIGIDEQVTPSKLVSLSGSETTDSLSFVVPKGMRAISIQADQVLSAGGLVLPGDYVDIIGVLMGIKPDGSTVDNYVVKTILQNVQVLAVAQKIADTASTSSGSQSSSGSQGKANPEATTLTILTSPEQAELLFLAESNGTLRAVVRGFGDADVTEVRPILQTEISAQAPASPGG